MKSVKLARGLFCALGVLALCVVGCSKDEISKSKHPFSAEQQKAVDAFSGDWRGLASSYFTAPDCLSFGWHSDTNVIIWKDDYLHGREEEFRYQGEVVLRQIQWSSTGNDTVYTPCWYYVSPLALEIDLYRKSDHQRIWNGYDLEFVSASQFKVRYRDAYNKPWCTFVKQ